MKHQFSLNIVTFALACSCIFSTVEGRGDRGSQPLAESDAKYQTRERYDKNNNLFNQQQGKSYQTGYEQGYNAGYHHGYHYGTEEDGVYWENRLLALVSESALSRWAQVLALSTTKIIKTH